MTQEYEKYRESLAEYIKVVKKPGLTGAILAGAVPGMSTVGIPGLGKRLAEFIHKKQEPFNKCLFQMIDEKGLKDSDVYKQSGLTRQMFSKIRCKEDYIPTKSIMLSLAVGMQLTVQETEKLLASGNQLLSMSDTGDLIVRFFMEQGVYNLDVYNEYLFEYDQHILGSTTREQ